MGLRRRVAALALAAAIVVAASPALAGEDGGADGGSIEPPVPIQAGTVPYPEGEQDAASVVVKILVGEDGHVADVKIISGEEPYASAVLTAAKGWIFTPAKRAGNPIPVRIRMRVAFRPPPPEPPAPPEPLPPPVKPPAAKPPVEPPAPPTEVHVRGKRNEIGQTQMNAGEVRQMPGAFGDAFRAIEALPGVTPIVSGLPFFFVRGAPPENTGYFVDGVRVPLLYHLALGPSVIHPGLIDRVDFYPGGFPARYGRYAGGILDGETTAPARKARGEFNVRLFDTGALAEVPLLDGRLTMLAAGRISYTAPLVSIFAPDTRVSYWDYQTRVAYKLTPKDTISLFWFGSFDEIDARSRQEETDPNPPHHSFEYVSPWFPVYKTEFHRWDVRYDHESAHGKVRAAATFGIEDSLGGSAQTVRNPDGTPIFVVNTTRVTGTSFGLRTEGEERETEWLKLRYGSDVQLYNYILQETAANSNAGALYPARNDVMMGVYADTIWKAGSRVEIVPGLRFDAYTSRLTRGQTFTALNYGPASLTNATAEIGVDPRLATRVTVTDRVAWITTFGVSHQPPSFVVPIPGLSLGRLNGGLQTSLQTSQGVEIKLPLDFSVTATGFLHEYLGLTDATASCLSSNGTIPSGDVLANNCLADRVRGRAYGLEVFFKRDFTKRFTGWVSYTLSRSTRETHGQTPIGFSNFSGQGSQALTEIPSEFDRTHVLNVIGAFDMGSGWRAGTRFLFYTGRPYTKTTADGIPIPPYNTERLPPFFRIDVRLEKRWRISNKGFLSLVLEGMNVTLNKEAVYAKPDGTPQYIGPISVPSIGVEGSF